jgi:hypothetical protein
MLKEPGVYRGDQMREAQNGQPSALWMPRSRGAVGGLLLVILGAWGALIPFVGPHFNFAYTPDQDWAWSTARGWLEVLPGAATAVGGLLLILSANRVSAMPGGWLAVLAGAWFVVGCQVAPLLGIGSAGDPIAATERKRAALQVSYFSGLGALIIFVGGIVLARTAVRLARDVESPAVGADDPSPLVSSGAITRPRVGQYASSEAGPKRAWRRHNAGAAAGSQGAAYLRWPHPQG